MEKKYWDNIVQTPVDLINQDGVINPGSIKDRKHSRIKLEKRNQLSTIRYISIKFPCYPGAYSF